MKPVRTALAILAAALAAPASAVEYAKVQPERSTIAFTYQQMGVKMDGHFRKFGAELSFDPARPAAARAVIDVDLASVDVGSPEADQEVVGKPWFNVKGFPTARFASGAVKALGGNRYEVAGRLTIKGATQDVVVPATLSTQGANAVFEGTLPIRRGDFSIGEGSWAKPDVVANEVQIRFRIVAAPK